MAGQELLRLVESDPNGLPCMDPIKDFNLKNLEFAEKFKKKNQLENSLDNYQCLDCPQFIHHVSCVVLSCSLLFFQNGLVDMIPLQLTQ